MYSSDENKVEVEASANVTTYHPSSLFQRPMTQPILPSLCVRII